MSTCKETTLILGGGLSGLSAAYHGGGSIYEKEPISGGTCRSPEAKGYTFDLGIHVLHTKDKVILDLLNKLGVELFDQPRDAWIFSFDQLTRYPFQANTFGLPLPVIKDCLEGFIENYCKRKYVDEELVCENYEEWIDAAFGKGIARHFMIPYSEKFWTVPPHEMTTDWLDIRIPMPDMGEVIEGSLSDQDKGFGPNMMFKYPKQHGISALPRAFVDSGVQLNLNKKATALDLKKRIVSFEDGSNCAYESLISTIPLPELFKLFKAPDDVQDAIDDLRYNSILCVNIGVSRENLNEKHWIYYPEEQYPFFRISFPERFASYLTPAKKCSISAEIAYSKTKAVNMETIADSVIDGLITAGILTADDHIDFVDLQDLKYGYVIFDHKRQASLTKIKAYLTSQNIIAAGRYGSWEYQWMDDAILDGIRAAKEAQHFSEKTHDIAR